jgi:hypothetical protein
MRKDQEEQNMQLSEREEMKRPHRRFLKRKIRVAGKHYQDLDERALAEDIRTLQKYQNMVRLDKKLFKLYNSKIEKLEKAKEEITVTDDSISFLDIMAFQRNYDNSTLDEAREWAYEDLKESETTGETKHMILSSLVKLNSIEEDLSPEARDQYLSVVGEMFVNMTKRLGFEYRRYSLDIGRELYDRLLNEGDILRNTDNDLVYSRETIPQREKGFLERVWDSLFLRGNVQFRGTRYDLNSEDGRQRFDEDYHLAAGDLTREEIEKFGALISSPKPELLEERVEPSEEESRFLETVVLSNNGCPPYIRDECSSCRGMH